MRKRFLIGIIIICCVFLQISLFGCVSAHVAEGFGNAVWESNEPYFYWHEDVSYKKSLYADNVNYVIPKDADEAEILTLYGKMEINGEITFIEFIRSDLSGNEYGFNIVIFRSNVLYLEGYYTYKKVIGKNYDYEVYLTVKNAHDTNIVNDSDGIISGEETDLPLESFTIYVTLDE